MTSKRVLITGATGFIGAHVARRLLRAGFEVHALCRRGSSRERLRDLGDEPRLHTVSLFEPRRLRRAVESIAPDYVIHLAAATMKAGTAAAPATVVRTNLLGTINLLEACDGVDYAGLVNTGDAFEYGPRRRPAKESDRCRPTTVDGRARQIATVWAQHAALARGKPIVTLRLFSVFGPDDHRHRLVPQVIERSIANAPLLLSSPAVARDFVHVDDVAGAYLAAMRVAAHFGGEVFNVGSGRRTTLAELVECVRALTRSRSEVRWGAFPLAAHDRGDWTADVAKAEALLRWKPRLSLEQGLRSTVRWAMRRSQSQASSAFARR